jgi:copper homeostasis protein
MKYEHEVGARNVADALSAWRGGADRVELYVSPTEGALTPSYGLVKEMMEVKKATGIGLGIFVMIRPRSGDPLYTDEEFKVMLRDTEALYDAGAEGFMCGIVTPEGELDVKRMKQIIDKVPGRRFTLHRGFESVKDQSKALEQAVDLGIEFILTGGLMPGYQFDFKRLMALHEQAAGRIKIMVALGGAFKTPDLPQLLIPGMPFDYHIVNGYRQRKSEMKYVPGMKPGDDDYLMKNLSTVDYLEESTVREIRDIMDKYLDK